MIKPAPRRTRPGPHLQRFAEIYDRLGRGEQLTHSDLGALSDLLAVLLNDGDPRAWFYLGVEGRPSEDDVAVFIAADVELRAAQLGRVKPALHDVADTWQMSVDQIKRLRRIGLPDATAWLAGADATAARRVIEAHREMRERKNSR